MELARFVLIFGALASLTSATYYRSPYVIARRSQTEETADSESERLGKTETLDNNVVKKAAARDSNFSENEENGENNEEGDLQTGASQQDYSAASYPHPYNPFYVVQVDESGKTVERPIVNGHGTVALPGLHVGAVVGQEAYHVGGGHYPIHIQHGGGAAAAAAAAAGGAHQPIHIQHGGGEGLNFAASGSIAASLPQLLNRPHHNGEGEHHVQQPVHYGGQVYHGGLVPVRPSYHVGGYGVQHIVGGGYGSHQVGGSSYGHRPQIQHVGYRPTGHVRPPYSWSSPHSYHREVEPFVVVNGIPHIHAAGAFNYAEGGTTGLGGIHTSPGNPLVISLPVAQGEFPVLSNFAQFVQRPLQVIGTILNTQRPFNNRPEQGHKPVHEPDHKPVHEPVHKPVHEPVHKPVHEPVHKPVHEAVNAPVQVNVQAVINKKPSETASKPQKPLYVTHDSINKPQYRPGHNKGDGVSQSTIKPTPDQFSKSNVKNVIPVIPQLARSDDMVETKSAASENNPVTETIPGLKAEDRAEPSGQELSSQLNSVDSVVEAEVKSRSGVENSAATNPANAKVTNIEAASEASTSA